MPRVIAKVTFAVAVCVASAAGSSQLWAQNGAGDTLPEKYLQVTRDKDNNPRSLDTAVATFVPKSGPANVTVDLVSAIHIGDPEYFECLDRLFEDYDVVLYEMVKPKDASPVRKFQGRDADALAVFQRLLPSLLDLEFQVDSVDYSAKNFVHADLSPKQLKEAMEKRGETGMSLVLKAIPQVLQQYFGQVRGGRDISEAELMAFLTQKEGAKQLKTMLVDKLDELGPSLGLGESIDGILITDRNQAALAELKHQLDRRKNGEPLRIAIYYGAAHMPDMANRLTKDFDMKLKEVTWVTAWDLTRAPKRSALEGLLNLLQEVQ